MRLFLLFFLFPITAFSQISENVDLLYLWHNTDLTLNYRNARYSDVWGFVQDGREYGVIGSTYGAHIFDVTDPSNAHPVDSVGGAVQGYNVNHRDFHDYNGYLYGVADQGEATLQIIDLHFLPDSVSLVYNSSELVMRAHNVFIDSSAAMMYICGPSGSGGMRVYSLEDPISPVLVYVYNDYYVHDVFVSESIAYMNCGSGVGYVVMDFSDASNPVFLGDMTTYPDQGYNHSGWLSEDKTIYAFADENYGLDIKICDVSDIGNMNVLSTINSNVTNSSVAHNVMIKDGFLYVSYYNDGLQIFDISDPSNPTRAGYYDTFDFPQSDDFRGAWGVYAFLPSGNILISDRNTGFHVLDPQNAIVNNESYNNDIIFDIFPNPTKGSFTVEYDGIIESIKLLNLQGKNIEIELDGDKVILDNNLPSGLYIVQLLADERLCTKTIHIQD